MRTPCTLPLDSPLDWMDYCWGKTDLPVIVLVGIRTTTLKDDLNFEFENSDILHETENKRRRTTTATTLTFEF